MGHHSARQAAKKDLQGKRQQISSLMLRPGRAYPGKTTWGACPYEIQIFGIIPLASGDFLL